MDIEKLIEQLRSYTYWLGQDGPESHDIHHIICDDAATALSTLHGENEKLRAEQQKSENDNVNLTGELAKVAAELEQVKRCIEIVEHQRDEAIYDMTALMAGQCCDLCAVEYCNDRGKTEMCTAFKWRGPQKED